MPIYTLFQFHCTEEGGVSRTLFRLPPIPFFHPTEIGQENPVGLKLEVGEKGTYLEVDSRDHPGQGTMFGYPSRMKGTSRIRNPVTGGEVEVAWEADPDGSGVPVQYVSLDFPDGAVIGLVVRMWEREYADPFEHLDVFAGNLARLYAHVSANVAPSPSRKTLLAYLATAVAGFHRP